MELKQPRVEKTTIHRMWGCSLIVTNMYLSNGDLVILKVSMS